MKPIATFETPLAKCAKTVVRARLSGMTQALSHQQVLSRKLLSCAGIGLGVSLAGCQTLPASTTPRLAADTPTAHGLMTQTMLQRFDQSYEYQKTTHYQVASLYPTDDIEAQDHSLFFTVLQVFTGDNQSAKTRHVTGAQLACEDTYTRRYQAIVSESLVTVSDNSTDTANAKISEAKAAYDGCLARAGISPQSAQNTNTETLSTSATPVTPYTTVGSITAQQPVDNSYQTTVKKLVTFFEMLDRNLHDTANTSKQKQPADDSTSAVSTEIPNDRAPQKYPEVQDSDSVSPEDMSEAGGELPDFGELQTKNAASSVVKLLRNLRLTPEQIQVLNEAYLTPKTIRYQGNYNHEKGQFSSVLEESSDMPYKQSYKRIPMLIDFNEMSVTFEPDAALPVAGLFFDKALPANLAGKSIKFVLPDSLRQNIPLPLLKTTLIHAIGQAYGDIDPEKYNELRPDTDVYAKTVKAHRVIKVQLTPQDMGFVVGRTLKYWSGALANIRAEHPEYIKHDGNFAATLDLMAAANRLYRAEDLAKITQLLEAVLPISYNSYNYYYFDRDNQLVGYRKVRDYQTGLLKARGKAITTSHINYHRPKTTRPYYQPKPDEVIDGNALLKKLSTEQRLKREAKDARFGYVQDTLTTPAETATDSDAAVLDSAVVDSGVGDSATNQDITLPVEKAQ